LLLLSFASASVARARDRQTFGVFLNEGPGVIELELYNAQNQLYASVALPVGELHRIDLVEGTAKTRRGSHVFEGQIVSERKVNPNLRPSEFFEAQKREFYYILKNGKIEPVPVANAGAIQRQWRDLERGTEQGR
jgi:hypothetical protein